MYYDKMRNFKFYVAFCPATFANPLKTTQISYFKQPLLDRRISKQNLSFFLLTTRIFLKKRLTEAAD